MKTISDVSPDVIVVRERLDGVSPGELVPYDELSSLIGTEIRLRRHILRRALRQLLAGDKVFACVTNVGVQRLTDSQIARAWRGDLRSIRRRASRVQRKLQCVEWDKLSPDDQLAHNVGMTYAATLKWVAEGKKVKRVEGMCRKAQDSIPPAKILEMFR